MMRLHIGLDLLVQILPPAEAETMIHDVPSLIAPVSGGFAAIVPRNGAAYNGFPATMCRGAASAAPCASFGPLQHFQHEPPHPLDGGDLHPLPRGVDVQQIRANGHTVQPRQLAAQNTALHAAWMASIFGFRPYCS